MSSDVISGCRRQPPSPEPYWSDSTKALNVDDLDALPSAMRARFTDDVGWSRSSRRDYALLLFSL